MRIGINALCVGNRSGTGRYAAQLTAALASVDEENEYFVCLPDDSPLRETLADRSNFHLRLVSGGAKPWRRLWFERFGLRAWMASNRLDVFHGPAFLVPARCVVPSVVTVHDLVFLLFPETIRRGRRHYFEREIPRSIREARLVLCDSANTANDLRKRLGTPLEKLIVAPLGVEERFFEAPDEKVFRCVRKRYSLPDRFLLALGTLEPRKNIPALLRAYARLPESTPALVLVGRRGWGESDLEGLAANLGLKNRVCFPGFVADDDLPALYRLAELFVHVSRYEGFGLPVLEAMASGAPTAATANSSIPEIARENEAFLIRGEDEERIANGLREALADPAERLARAEQAAERARSFSWSQTARVALEAYRRAVGM